SDLVRRSAPAVTDEIARRAMAMLELHGSITPGGLPIRVSEEIGLEGRRGTANQIRFTLGSRISPQPDCSKPYVNPQNSGYKNPDPPCQATMSGPSPLRGRLSGLELHQVRRLH
ncbi:hypothetical protein, partial [Mesorhizobium sp.]|uniref:hypothetical protein n=1 Tax=Mesorhizobium sp. TaxID=1871066 RepID=UPI00257A744D